MNTPLLNECYIAGIFHLPSRYCSIKVSVSLTPHGRDEILVGIRHGRGELKIPVL